MADRSFSAKDKAAAARREAGFRRYVYPKRVSDGKMKQEDADRQIAIMDAIAADYDAQAKVEEQEARLL